MPPRTYLVSPGDVLHVTVPGKGRHLGNVIDIGPGGEVVFAVATSGDWKSEPIRRVMNLTAEPARSWITDWPKDNGELSYFYGDFIDTYDRSLWIRVIGRVPRPIVDGLQDLYLEWDSRRKGTPIPPGRVQLP